jgi:hypothetical protein
MQQKTDGRVVRLLSKHLATAKGGNEIVEVIGNIPASRLASWGLTNGDVRVVLPGEPIIESQ